jgi:glucan-binding YG repeat protein
MIGDRLNEIPKFDFDQNEINITGRSIPEFAAPAWFDFLEELRIYIKKRNLLYLNFKLDYYNSSSSIYINDMFNVLTENAKICRSTVNWYYFEADETTMEDGEIYKEQHPKIKINLISRTT